MTLTEDHVQWLTKELYKNLLLAIRVNRNFPQAYRHASKTFQGIGFTEIKAKHKISMVSYFMMHGTS